MARLTESEANFVLARLAVCYRDMPWLKSIAESTEFHWDSNIGEGNLGAFSILHPDCVYLMEQRDCLDMLIPTVVHELTHKRQFEEMGFRYYLAAIPGIRQIALEKEAKANEELAQKILNIQL